MEQIGLALILFAAFWVGCAAGYIAMRLRSQVAYEKGRNESAAEISALTERVNSRDLQFTEARQRADTAAETITRMETELRAETDRRTIAEARLTLLPKYEADLETRGRKLAEQQAELTKLHVSTSELSTRLEETKRTSEDRISAIQALQSRVTESFQTLSAEALMANNKAFLDLAGDALTRLQDSARGDLDQRQSLFGQIMEPLKSSLDRVDSRISELERDRVTAYAGLQQQVESMMRTQVSLQAETSHLASALRTPSSRGRWGEVQLRRVVELAGMISHCDFIEPRPTEDGGVSSRPDLIVQLPNFRQIVVDSKVSLAAYLESNDATDEATRLEKRREHAARVRAHVTQLSAKGYWDQFPQSPEFVIAFLPGESFFSAALEHDPELLEFGVERRVIVATPTTLIALLRAVAWGWKQEMVSSNAREIRDLGKSLYDRLRSLADNFTEVQRGLSRTTAAFNRTVGTFESSVIPSARRMRELGASTGDEIVSPPPVDSTPRSVQVLAEATEPAPTAAPLAKIGINVAVAQPRGVSSRQTVEPASAKASQPVPVSHTAFDRQKPNGIHSAEAMRPNPSASVSSAESVNAARPAVLHGTGKLLAPAAVEPTLAADSARPSPRSVPVPAPAEAVKPQERIAPAILSVVSPAGWPSAAQPVSATKSMNKTPAPPVAIEPLTGATTGQPSTSIQSKTTEPVAKPIAAVTVSSANEPQATSTPSHPTTTCTVATPMPIAASAVPSANEPASTEPASISTPTQPTATVPVTLSKPVVAPPVPAPVNEPPATQPTAVQPVTAAINGRCGPELETPATSSEPSTALVASELSNPTFVLATLPLGVKDPIAPPPVLSASEPASGESLKALAALYTSRPNGIVESSPAEPRAQAVEAPVIVAS